MATTHKLASCPFCNADIHIEITAPHYGVQSCDAEPGNTELLPDCECLDELQALGGTWEKYVERVVEGADDG